MSRILTRAIGVLVATCLFVGVAGAQNVMSPVPPKKGEVVVVPLEQIAGLLLSGPAAGRMNCRMKQGWKLVVLVPTIPGTGQVLVATNDSGAMEHFFDNVFMGNNYCESADEVAISLNEFLRAREWKRKLDWAATRPK